MKKSGTTIVRTSLILAAALAVAWLLPADAVISQQADQGAVTATTEPDATAADDAAAASDRGAVPGANSTSPATPTQSTAEAPVVSGPPTNPDTPTNTGTTGDDLTEQPGAESMDDAVPSHQSSLPAGATEPSVAEQAADAAGAAAPGDGTSGPAKSGWSPLKLIIVLVALFAVPIFVGNYLAKQWRMPDHAWKFSLVVGTLAASILICTFGQFKFGPDLAGGITLIYQLDEGSTQTTAPRGANSPGAANQEIVQSAGREFKLAELIAALKKRLDPDGTKEITIRSYGQAVEIIIPQTGQDEMEFVKRKITDLGQLEFRITADQKRTEDKSKIEQAKLLSPNQKVVTIAGNDVAKWVPYDLAEFGPVDQTDERGIVKRMAGKTPELLVLMDPWNVTGDYLTRAVMGLDDRGGPAVHFSFNSLGAQQFRQLTGKNKPNPATPDVYRHLGIMLDGRLMSAPRIITTISDQGMISGGSMTDEEVKHTIEVLNAGSLPAALDETPISEEIISPTLGSETIEQGKLAIGASLLAIVLFMLIYYRFAGLVACLALTFNLLLVLALMVMINAAFTLPGLAGLVLTIGMAVDANVLIYERIREEMKSGAALRMAIRNGFGRAMSAIIDSNVTTIITGIVLFYIGTDQVKGFAVTLILGILTSMFTAIFFARVVFDVAERRGWITNLKMMKILSQPNFDFLGVRWIAIGASLVLIAVGMAAVFARGKQLLDIDFTGGSSVTFILKDSAKMDIGQVREALASTELADKNLLIVERGTSRTRYQIDTSEQSVDKVMALIAKTFGDKLMTYSLEFQDLKPFEEGGVTGVEATLLANSGRGYAADDGMSYEALRDWIRGVLEKSGHRGIEPTLTNPDYQPGSAARYKKWTVRFTGLDQAAVQSVLEQVQQLVNSTPLFPLASKIGGRVSENMQYQALYAIGISLLGVIAYLWLRFQKVTYGLAAGAALVHDVLVTIGMMALDAYIVRAVPGLAEVFKLEAFQINLTIVAALLTIIGYSLNDTIVTFDRLREIKGKSPNLTPTMVNASVNQCLSRTILTALTVFLVVTILYFFGGEGIHSFAFAFLVGVIAGTYSTVYIAAPVLLWLSGAPITPVERHAGTTA